ncbi:MAG: hypothetical protein RR091_13205, partial [Cloacibacillus sp.]
MSEKQKPLAYYKRVVMNSLKNEYRQNDNAAKHITPVGEDLFSITEILDFDLLLELELSGHSPENWLLFIENQQLYKALRSLRKSEMLFVFLKFNKGYSQAELAAQFGLTQQAI